MVFALFNGSYIGKRNTGIGVVAKNLARSLSTDHVGILDPLNKQRDRSIQIPSDLSPENGFKAHLKRLYWVQSTIPKLDSQHTDLVAFSLSSLVIMRRFRLFWRKVCFMFFKRIVLLQVFFGEIQHFIVRV